MSIRKIAMMTGLSIATVSNVINGTRPASEESRVKVMEAAEQIGYRPNLAARMLRTQQSMTIAFIIPTDPINRNANFFYMDVLLGINQKLWETGYHAIVANYGPSSSERSLSAVEVCRKQWVDGVILVPSSLNVEQLDVLRQLGAPFVLADRRVNSNDYSFVGSDNEAGAYQAVQLFAACGKKKIGLIGGALKISAGYERCRGYKRAMEDLGLTYCEEHVMLTQEFSVDKGAECARALMEKGVDSILVTDNMLTMGAFEELQRLGVSIPDEVGLIGYDDFEWMEFTTPAITAVQQQAFQMGYVAAEMMMRKLSGMDANERNLLETKLILRGSHGNVGK